MVQHEKRILACIVFMAVLCTAFPSFAEIISNITNSVSCGAYLAWEYDTETKILTISGTGKMSEFDSSSTGMLAPWKKAKDAKNLEKVLISEGVTTIGDNAFFECDNLISVISSDYVVKPGTKSIAACAFYYCQELTGITLPDSMAGIGNRAFEHCSKLTSVTIPSRVTSIGDSVFNICPGLTGISVAEDNPAYCSVNGVLYNKDKTALIRFPQGKQDTRFTIPNGVTSISVGAFADCSSLTSVTIPNGVTSIGSEAFSTCSALTSITITDGVTIIDQKTFYDCSGLTSITIPNSVLIIGENAFEGCRTSMKVYYTGSEADWGEVIGDGKSVLKDTNIYYCKGITATRNDDGTIEVSPNKIDSGTVILALYGGDKGDKLIEMQSEKYSGTKITFTATQAYTRAKIMIWNSLGGMSPECGIKNVR